MIKTSIKGVYIKCAVLNKAGTRKPQALNPEQSEIKNFPSLTTGQRFH